MLGLTRPIACGQYVPQCIGHDGARLDQPAAPRPRSADRGAGHGPASGPSPRRGKGPGRPSPLARSPSRGRGWCRPRSRRTRGREHVAKRAGPRRSDRRSEAGVERAAPVDGQAPTSSSSPGASRARRGSRTPARPVGSDPFGATIGRGRARAGAATGSRGDPSAGGTRGRHRCRPGVAGGPGSDDARRGPIRRRVTGSVSMRTPSSSMTTGGGR